MSPTLLVINIFYTLDIEDKKLMGRYDSGSSSGFPEQLELQTFSTALGSITNIVDT